MLEGSLPALGQETHDILHEEENVRIERIVSFGHSSPQGFWYDQSEDEWVVLLEGEAILEDSQGGEIHMKPGDAVWIPAGFKHRVAWTSKARPTFWFAVFIRHDPAPPSPQDPIFEREPKGRPEKP